jgi:hypothetical protein
MLSASPQHSEAPANTTTEARKNRLRPNRPFSLPASERARTKPTEYAVITQLVQLIEVCRPCWIACRAVATMVPSSELMSRAMATTEKIATRCGCGAGAWVTSVAAVSVACPSHHWFYLYTFSQAKQYHFPERRAD